MLSSDAVPGAPRASGPEGGTAVPAPGIRARDVRPPAKKKQAQTHSPQGGTTQRRWRSERGRGPGAAAAQRSATTGGEPPPPLQARGAPLTVRISDFDDGQQLLGLSLSHALALECMRVGTLPHWSANSLLFWLPSGNGTQKVLCPRSLAGCKGSVQM